MLRDSNCRSAASSTGASVRHGGVARVHEHIGLQDVGWGPEVVPAVEPHHLVGLEVDELGDQQRPDRSPMTAGIHDLGVREPLLELDREGLGV